MCASRRGAGDAGVSLTGPDGGVTYVAAQNMIKAEAGFNYNETDQRLRITTALTDTTFGGDVVLDLAAAASGRASSLKLWDGTNQAAYFSYLNGASAPRLGIGGAAETLSFVLSTGYTGFGTTGPLVHLQVNGATADSATIRAVNTLVAPTGSTGNAVLGLYNEVNDWAINGDTGGSLLINDDSLASITRVSVAPVTGNVAIGGALAGSYTLHVGKAVAADWLTAVENTDTGAGDVYIGHGTGEGMAVVAGTDLSTVGASYAFKVDRAAASYLYVHANGSLGIGTASPTTLIHALKAQNAPTVVTIDNTTSGTSAFASYTVAASAAHAYLYAFSAGYTTSGAYMADGVTLEAGTDASAGLNLIANASAPIRFYTAGANLRGQWDASGNLNVANLTPSLPVCTDGSSNLISCSSTITGSGTAGQVTYWSGTSALTGSVSLTLSTGGVIDTLIVGNSSATPTQILQSLRSPSGNDDYSTSATSQGYAIAYDSGVNSVFPSHHLAKGSAETGRHTWTEYNFTDLAGNSIPAAGWFAVSGVPAAGYLNGSSIRFYTATWDGISALARYERFAISDSGTTTRGTVEITPANSAFSTAAITTTATTFSFLNGGATSVNIAQTATTLSIGATTGTTTVNNTLAVIGNIDLATNQTSVLRAKTSGGSTVALLSLTNDANNITRMRAGVDAGGIQFTNQAASSPWALMSGAGIYGFVPFLPASNDLVALGASGTAFSDLFLASGGVLNWSAGDVTVTHAANTLDFAGASSGYGFDAKVSVATASGATVHDLLFLENSDAGGTWNAGTALLLGYSRTNADANSRIVGYTNAAATNASKLQIQTHSSTSGVYNVGLYMDDAGLVGINTASPAYQLDVSGSTRIAGRLLETQGADVASAGDLTLGADGTSFEITGTATVNAITIAGWQNGSRITVICTSTSTWKHNTAGGAGTVPMLLDAGSDFACTADDTLTLLLSERGGTQAWRQVGRSVN